MFTFRWLTDHIDAAISQRWRRTAATTAKMEPVTWRLARPLKKLKQTLLGLCLYRRSPPSSKQTRKPGVRDQGLQVRSLYMLPPYEHGFTLWCSVFDSRWRKTTLCLGSREFGSIIFSGWKCYVSPKHTTVFTCVRLLVFSCLAKKESVMRCDVDMRPERFYLNKDNLTFSEKCVKWLSCFSGRPGNYKIHIS